MERGQIVKHRKSGKPYMVLSVCGEWLSVRSVRDGKAFGPSRNMLVADVVPA
jgi:hypothetical protein